jgi:multidrug efflux pump subunit AcrB
MVVILLCGVLNLNQIKRTLFPEIKSTELHISTIYLGGSAEVVERNITRKIEKAIRSLPHIKSSSSISTESLSYVNLRLNANLNQRKIEELITKTRSAINLISDFPIDLKQKPTTELFNLEDLPIITIGIKNEVDSPTAMNILTKLDREIRRLPLISKTEIFGKEDTIYRASISPSKLIEQELTLEDISQILSSRFFSGNLGKIKTNESTKNLVFQNTDFSIKDFGETILYSNFSGKSLKLNDIAEITRSKEVLKTITKINGKKVLGLRINKKTNADLINSVQSVKNAAATYQDQLVFADDLSRYIKTSYDVVKSNALMGFIIVFIVLVFFLNWRTAFWVSMGIPVSILLSLLCLRALGFAIDIISLSGIILVLGIVVDDAIVIAEGIEYEKEKGLPGPQAALNAVKKLSLPLLASVFTTMIAFTPLFFLSGEDGDFLFTLPLIIILVLAASLIESLFLLPGHMAHSQTNINSKRTFTKMIQCLYKKILLFLLTYPKTALLKFTVVFFVTIYISVSHLQFIVYPQDGAEEFTIYLTTPSHYDLNKTSKAVKSVEQILNSKLEKNILSYTTTIGSHGDEISVPFKSKINVSLSPFSQRNLMATDIIEQIKVSTNKLIDFEKIRFTVDDVGPAETKSIFIKVIGDNDNLRNIIKFKISNLLKQLPNSKDYESDDDFTKDAVRIILYQAEISKMNTNTRDVLIAINQMMEGVETKILFKNQKDQKVIVEVKKSSKNITTYLDSVSLKNRDGKLIKLKGLYQLEKTTQLIARGHYNGERGTRVGIDYNLSHNEEDQLVKNINKIVSDSGDGEVYIEFGGNYLALRKSSNDGVQAFILAILGVFCVLVILFNSLKKPLLVLITMPFGVMGVLWVFLFHGLPISFPAILGLVGLVGVVVNDSILLITEFFNQLEIHSGNAKIAILNAASTRLRPIILTTLTTSLGLIPIGYGLGGVDPFNAPMALSLGWGILIATPLILTILPCLLYLLYKKEL